LGALMRPRKAKPSPQGSYGQWSPCRITKSSVRQYASRPCTGTLRHGDVFFFKRKQDCKRITI
jgi:hypothetical protein